MDYKTVAREAEATIIEKKSRFIGYVFPVSTEAEALEKLESIRTKHYDARHNVFAYRLQEQQIARYSDDGEPAQSAGMPVLDVIQKSGLYNVLIVVTRYFGGILLGVGGLVRAYTEASKAAIEAAGVIEMKASGVLLLDISYSLYGKVKNVIANGGGVIEKTDFGEQVQIKFHAPKALIASLKHDLIQATNAAIQIQDLPDQFYEYK
jgi:uncharacterized YigZ family protein